MNLDFWNLVTHYGYLGVFLVSLLSNGTVIFPVPYLLVLYSVGAAGILDPITVAIVSGLGATLGELTLYFLSMLWRVILPTSIKNRIDYVKRVIDKYGAMVIFIFALTPLPDDVIYPVLGLMKYDFKKVFISCFLGKTILSGTVVYAGYYSFKFLETLVGGESMIAGLIALIIGIVVAIIFLRVDWSRYIKVE